MQTDPIYLTDPYKINMQACVLDVSLEKEGVYKLILDQTVFYPMGGGQPTDQGTLETEDGISMSVYQVLMKDGEITHYVKTTDAPQKGQKVTGSINWERRFKNMRVHTAGHIVDFAVHLLGYSPEKLLPVKGDHGKKPFVMFEGTAPDLTKDILQKKVDEIIAQKKAFSWKFLPLEELKKEAIYLQPGLPVHKPLRVLSLEGVGSVADGGTIVKNTQEVETTTIVSIEVDQGYTKIRYTI